jgi:hypothetical protein
MCEKKPGYYLGTEIDNKWWRRYRHDGFFARGNGTYWFEEQSFQFLRYLTSKPLRIPYRQIDWIKLGAWHAGRWTVGRPIVKLGWHWEGMQLSSGFVVAKRPDEIEAFIQELSRRIDPDM